MGENRHFYIVMVYDDEKIPDHLKFGPSEFSFYEGPGGYHSWGNVGAEAKRFDTLEEAKPVFASLHLSPTVKAGWARLEIWRRDDGVFSGKVWPVLNKRKAKKIAYAIAYDILENYIGSGYIEEKQMGLTTEDIRRVEEELSSIVKRCFDRGCVDETP